MQDTIWTATAKCFCASRAAARPVRPPGTPPAAPGHPLGLRRRGGGGLAARRAQQNGGKAQKARAPHRNAQKGNWTGTENAQKRAQKNGLHRPHRFLELTCAAARSAKYMPRHGALRPSFGKSSSDRRRLPSHAHFHSLSRSLCRFRPALQRKSQGRGSPFRHTGCTTRYPVDM
jgi:hypothetical protein